MLLGLKKKTSFVIQAVWGCIKKGCIIWNQVFFPSVKHLHPTTKEMLALLFPWRLVQTSFTLPNTVSVWLVTVFLLQQCSCFFFLLFFLMFKSLSSTASMQDVQQWLHKNRFNSYTRIFTHFSGTVHLPLFCVTQWCGD